MWRAIADRGTLFGRRQDAGELRCFPFELAPDSPPGGYTGDVVLRDPPLRLRYEGREPVLSRPRIEVGDVTLPLPCTSEGESAWFFEQDACLDESAAAPLTPSGCLWPDDEHLEGMLSGRARAQLLERVLAKGRLWVGSRCTEHVVAKTKAKPFPRRASGEVIALYPRNFGYPSHLEEEGDAVLVSTKVAANNPYRPPRPPGGGTIAVGCCGKPSRFHVLQVGDDAAVLLRHPSDSQEGAVLRWHFSAEACEAASRQTPRR